LVSRSESFRTNLSAETVRVPLQDTSHSRKKAQLLAAMERPRPPLPANQRKFKTGTTGFMLAIHVGAVFALLPRF
jgi:stearoyl-CoA desaturase (delta-9 desaturase)